MYNKALNEVEKKLLEYESASFVFFLTVNRLEKKMAYGCFCVKAVHKLGAYMYYANFVIAINAPSSLGISSYEKCKSQSIPYLSKKVPISM